MKISSSHASFLVVWVMAMSHQILAQTAFTDGTSSIQQNTVEQKCTYSASKCDLRVGVRCRFRNPFTGRLENCIDLDGSGTFIEIPMLQCEATSGSIMTDAFITYSMCNDNDVAFKPRKSENRIKFRANTIEPFDWDDEIPKQDCREYQHETKIDLCKQMRVIEIQMDGNLNQVGQNYCRCYLWKESTVDLISVDFGRTDLPSPEPSPPPPTRIPTYSKCNLKKAIITELASPWNKVKGRYIEIYFPTGCRGLIINRNLNIVNMEHSNSEESRKSIDLYGKEVPDDGFFVICIKNNANTIYGQNTCDYIDRRSLSPANITGVETIAIVDGDPWATSPKIIDIFGFPHRENVEGSNQDFTGGRAVRKFSADKPSGFSWDRKSWIVIHDNDTNQMDPRVWQVVTKPPETIILITEIFDPFATEPVPRFIELYVPNEEDRGSIDDDLKLVIFRGQSDAPDWRYAFEINEVKKNSGFGDGFFVVCNDAAWNILSSTRCDAIFDFFAPAQSTKNRYQFAIVNGDQNGFFLVDVFGTIGDVDDPFVFSDSRAVRNLAVSGPTSKWSEDDWIIYKTGSEANSGIAGADPQAWQAVKFTAQPSIAPSVSPSFSPSVFPTEYDLDCNLYFTELADPVDNEDAAFIEIQTTCPNHRIRNVFVKTWKNEQNPKFELRLKVPDDGYIIICQNREAFFEAYGKTCDVEKPNALPKGLYSIALEYKDERLDIYGKPNRFLPSGSIFKNGRAYRDISSEDGAKYFDEFLWFTVPGKRPITASTDDMDPRAREVPPFELFFTEFADPVDGNNKRRFIELYSPNRRRYKIEEDLSIIKFAKKGNPYSYITLKGLRTNRKGFLVLCIEEWNKECTDALGSFSIVNGPLGTEEFSLAACANPKEEGMDNCPTIDNYAIQAQGSTHDFTNGRAVRRLDALPTPSESFNLSQWVIIPGKSAVGQQVSSYDTDPGSWYEVDDDFPNLKPKPPPSSAPSWMGKGSAKSRRH